MRGTDLGTISLNSSIFSLPTGVSPILMSMKTMGRVTVGVADMAAVDYVSGRTPGSLCHNLNPPNIILSPNQSKLSQRRRMKRDSRCEWRAVPARTVDKRHSHCEFRTTVLSRSLNFICARCPTRLPLISLFIDDCALRLVWISKLPVKERNSNIGKSMGKLLGPRDVKRVSRRM